MNTRSNYHQGQLYVVATPIGHLSDLSERAKDVLAQVDFIACEDTRHTHKLLQHLGLKKALISVHEHNEPQRLTEIENKLAQGLNIALVCDAGTPLISDPGYKLAHHLRLNQYKLVPIPGACAFIAALSVAGIASDRFCFEGFLPAKKGTRQTRLNQLLNESRTLIFYESKHRILASLQAMQEVFTNTRTVCVARELTKQFESIYYGTFSHVLAELSQDAQQQKGEFVIIVSGNPEPASTSNYSEQALFARLLKELAPNKAAAIMAEFSNEHKKVWYQRALALKTK